MPRIGPRVETRVEPTVGTRPLPRSLIEVYDWSESTFRRRVAELEEDPCFQRLVKKGVLERVRMRGRIPRHRYEDFKDRELTEFFRRYEIAEHPGWEQDFFGPGAMRRRHSLARKYGCPVGELVRVLRYCHYVYDVTDGGPARVVEMDSDSRDFLCFTPSDDLFDLAPIVSKLERFTSRHDLDRERFARLFFTGEREPESIAEELGCSLREVEVVRGLVERIQTLSSLQMDVGPSTQAAARPRAEPKQAPVAEFFHDPDGLPRMRLLADDLYDIRYRIREGEEDPEVTRQEQDFLQDLRAVNQRKSVLTRVLGFLHRFQYRYLTTGRAEDLLPLTQARVARELDEEEATISRLIRDKVLRTPWGTFSLKSFFVRVGRIVEILLTEREARELEEGTRERPFTDKEIQEILASEYGTRLSRRSITYHRNRSTGRSNFYSRRRRAKAGVQREGEA